MTTETAPLIDPYGDPILFIESHDGHPHSVVTQRRTYDFEFIPEPGYVLYHNSGSGCRDNAVYVGLLADPSRPVQYWIAPGVRMVDDERRELTPNEALARGFAQIPTTDNPFNDANEGRAVFCSITKQWWDDERPSPYLRYLEHSGGWGGCGAGEDNVGEPESRSSMIELARILGAAKARKLAEGLRDLTGTQRLSIETDHYHRTVTIILPSRKKLTFRVPDKAIPTIEPALAWLETVDADKAFGPAIDAVNWLKQTSHKLAFQRAAAKGIRIARAHRKLWRTLCATACHCDHRHGRELIRAYLAAVKAEAAPKRDALSAQK